MNDLIFVILLGSLGFVSTLIGLWKDYKNKSGAKKGFKGFKSEFYVLAVIGLCILSLTILQSIFANVKTEKDKQQEAAEQKTNDSITQIRIKAGIDSGIQIIANGFSKSFKSHGLKMDSVGYKVNSMIGKIASMGPDYAIPTLLITANGISMKQVPLQRSELYIRLSSYGGGSTNFHINLTLFPLYAKHLLFSTMIDHPVLDKNDRIPSGLSKGCSFQAPDKEQIKAIYVWLNGNYTDLSRRHKVFIDDMYQYDPVSNVTLLLNKHDKGIIISHAKRY